MLRYFNNYSNNKWRVCNGKTFSNSSNFNGKVEHCLPDCSIHHSRQYLMSLSEKTCTKFEEGGRQRSRLREFFRQFISELH